MKGKITISRVSCNQRDDYISISVVDDDSGIQFVKVEMELETFSNVLFAQAFQDCEFELRGTKLVGMKVEYKQELLCRPSNLKDESIFAEFEVDGWIGDRQDVSNHHCWRGKDFVLVGFHRYVKKETE